MKIRIYSTEYCPFCRNAEQLLTERGIAFDAIDVSYDDELRMQASAEAGGYRTVPMIFIGDEFIGGYQELLALDQSGELAAKISD